PLRGGNRPNVIDLRGTGVWPKDVPLFTPEQERVRDEFMARWLDLLPTKYGAIERFNHGYPSAGNPPRGRTLELGAGLGRRARFEDLNRQEYYTLEVREELAEVTRRRYPEVKTFVGDCQETLPFENDFFTRVVAIHVLEHLPNLPAALDQVARVLAPGGRFDV